MCPYPEIKKIGVFGHVAGTNLGDEAIIAAVIQNIRRRHPAARIFGFTRNPVDTEDRHQVTSFPIRRFRKNQNSLAPMDNTSDMDGTNDKQPKIIERVKTELRRFPSTYSLLKGIRNSLLIFWACLRESGFLVRCYRNLKGIDLLIIAGSQQLIDFIEGPWGHPYTIFKWSIIARIVKAKVAFLSIGAGPITSPLSRLFIKYALSHAYYRSYRDNISKNLIQQMGVKGENLIFPDLAYSLHFNAVKPTHHGQQGCPRIVGINAVPFSDPVYWPGSNASIYESYVRKLADFALWLIGSGYKILFIPTQLYLDPPVINDIRICMKNNGSIDFEEKIIDKPISSFDDLISSISMASIVLACRYHGVIISYLLNKPVLGIAYHKKTFDLMEQMGQSEYALDIHSFECNSLQQRFISLESNSVAIRKEIEQRTSISRQALDFQYDQVFRLLEDEKGQSY